MLILRDRTLVSATATGYGPFSVGAAPTAYNGPAAAGYVTGQTLPYTWVDDLRTPTQFEIGTGSYTGGSSPTISRTVLRSHLGDGIGINFAGGSSGWLFVFPSADHMVLLDPTSRRLVAGGAEVSTQMPVGALIAYGGTTAPADYLLADGSNRSRTTYAALYAVYGTTFGSGDGATTFGTPDLRGRVIIGRDDMGGSVAGRITASISGIAGTTLGAAGGDERFHAHNHGIAGFSGSSNGAAGAQYLNTNQYNTNGWTALFGAGSSQNVQPSLVLNFIIKI